MFKDYFLSLKVNPKRRRTLIYSVIGVLILTFVLFSNFGLINRLSLESEKEELKKKIINEKIASDSLYNRINKLETDSQTIEKEAREKYGMKKKGETIYIIKDKTKNNSKK